MRIVLQRVRQAAVEIENRKVAQIGQGYLLLVGFEKKDHAGLIQPMIEKLSKIKLFADENGRFAESILEIGKAVLVVSQFTLFADLKKGKKPSLSNALPPQEANQLYLDFVAELKKLPLQVETGIFGALMQVHLQNDGPVTVLLDSKELFPSLYPSGFGILK